VNKPKEENLKPNHGAQTGTDILPAEIFRLGSISAHSESPNRKQTERYNICSRCVISDAAYLIGLSMYLLFIYLLVSDTNEKANHYSTTLLGARNYFPLHFIFFREYLVRRGMK
jgi:hypothetical protein